MTIHEDTKKDAEAGARRFAAAVSGAIEGFLQALEDEDLTGTAREGMETAGEVARQAGSEAKDLAATPEMQQVGHAVGRAGERVADAASGFATDVRETAYDVKESVQGKVDDVKRAAGRVKDGVRVRAEAVAESGRRARVAPGKILHELREAVGSWWGALVTAIVMGMAIGVLGIVTLVVLTIALVVGLNQVFGDPRGTWLTVAIYAVVMGVAYAVMVSRRKAAKIETRRRLDASKEEARHVVAPVRSAFGGRGRAGF